MFIVSLPIQDRARSHRFYRALGLTAVGPLAEDGLPEPLQFDLAEAARLMLVPQDGFRWVLGGRPLAPEGSTECLLNLSAISTEALDDLIRRAREAGATVIVEPAQQPWGYSAVFTDPDGHAWMVTATP
ncbi:VOC family protein [Allokutzneria multivorans]|uniref:VOC family protein n=1 Tax=Allokutzneria multivorans TaxID=1142134 RepID=A0ABP7S476_9PSEU